MRKYLAGITRAGGMMFTLLLAACAGTGGSQPGYYSKSGSCAAFDTGLQETGYSARLAARPDQRGETLYEVHIQAVHAKSMASRIKRITYNDQTNADFNFVSDDCVCGMRIKNVDVECTHITNYIARISADTLQRSLEGGLAMTFSLENGRIVAGPRFEPGEVAKALSA